MNIYAYCGNNPINWLDPWGLKHYNRPETIDLINKALNSLWFPWHHMGGARYDFKPTGDTFDVPGYGEMSASEFGNYIAGLLGEYFGGTPGYYGVRAGGHWYAYMEQVVPSAKYLVGKGPAPHRISDDPASIRDIKRGRDHARKIKDNNSQVADPDNFGGRTGYGNWLEESKCSD